MSEVDVQVILNELKHIREDIAEMKDNIKNKCKDCLETGPTGLLARDIKHHWWHILAIWGCMGTFAGALYLMRGGH